MNKTMKAAPSRKTEIESFKKSIEAITQTYLASVDLCTDTEARIRSQYDAALASKDATIADLQAAREQAASAAEESARAAAQAVKDASTAQRQAETAERL
ncbi:MAG: hypothetical protein UHS47_12020 [Oscillospiraceae bacterium]|nr:hypothetical protein [Oscillospiraceae bacterium]